MGAVRDFRRARELAPARADFAAHLGQALWALAMQRKDADLMREAVQLLPGNAKSAAALQALQK